MTVDVPLGHEVAQQHHNYFLGLISDFSWVVLAIVTKSDSTATLLYAVVVSARKCAALSLQSHVTQQLTQHVSHGPCFCGLQTGG